MLWFLLLGLISTAASARVRLCVPETRAEDCQEMAKDLPESITCVVDIDIMGCLKKVSNGEADLMNADPRGIYLGGKSLGLNPVLTEIVDGEPYRYQGIALVSKDSDIQSASDLRGRTSCHTGLGRTVGWKIPVSMLLAKGIATPDCETGELGVVDRFFGGSCVAGKWSSDPVVDQHLKSEYPGLCSRCKDPATCSSDDAYYGYEGAMKCLSEGSGDVAFTKIPALRDYLKKDPDFGNKVDILCFDGGRKAVTDPEPCIWGARPTNAFLASSDKPQNELNEIISTMMEIQDQHADKPWYRKSFLSGSYVSGIRVTHESRNNYKDYLGDFLYAIKFPEPGCEAGKVNFCLTSDEGVAQCSDYALAVEAMDLKPEVNCVKSASKAACMELLKEGHAELLVLDGGDVYKGGKYYGLQPVAGELHNGSDASYYAVAVLHSASDVNSLADLKGLRSCHTGMGRTAGWVMPIGALLSAGLVKCGRANDVADFFSDGSCVPGANDTKYNPGRERSEDLCRHCVGDQDGKYKCARDSKERYSGYGGALRCLAEGHGDVAFVKHSTINDFVNGHGVELWAKDLLSSDFKLLCAQGGTEAYNHYLECHLGKVPSHYAMTGGDTSANRRLQLGKLLADSARFFGEDSLLFHLFRRRNLFAATGLKVAPLNKTYEDILGPEFLAATSAVDPKVTCKQ